MFCFMARKLISQEMDGMLPARKTRALEEHVGRCAACRAFREELDTGRRLLRATATEPSEAFAWTLQLKLNRALQGAAADNAVPWVDSARGSFGWFRSFALSSLAGVALTAAVAVWVLPLERSDLPAAGDSYRTEVASGASASPVTMSAGDPDRRPLTTAPRYRSLLSGSNNPGRAVSGGHLTQPNLLDQSGWVPTSWRGSASTDLDAINALREDNGRLRFMLQQMRAENAKLNSLLKGMASNYLESEDDEETD